MKIEEVIWVFLLWLLYAIGYWVGSRIEKSKWTKAVANTNLLFAGLKTLNGHMDETIQVMEYHKRQMDDLLKEHLELYALAKAAAKYQRSKNESH